MNRQWVIALMAALLGCLAAFGLTRYAVARPQPAADRLRDIAFLTRELELSGDQVREIGRLHVELGVQLDACCMRHCAAREKLAQALSATNGGERADALVADMCKAYEDGERATVAQLRNVRAVLTPEQRKRFDGMIADCMCRTCGMHGDRRPAGGMRHD